MNLKDYLKIRKEKCLYKICGEFIEVEAQQFIILARKQIQKNLNSHLNAQRLNSPSGGSGAKTPDLIPVNLIYSIRPAQSLVVSSQLIVDYIADKIEQSVSIQQIFNEILRFFETEALCVGPSFISTQQRSDITEKLDGMSSNAKRSEAKVLGDVKESSNHYVNKNESLQRPKILGFRIICSGRLQISSFSKPAEKAESIEITRGVLPLNTFKSNIDFAQTDATNAYGTCGIKVWVNRGE